MVNDRNGWNACNAELMRVADRNGVQCKTCATEVLRIRDACRCTPENIPRPQSSVTNMFKWSQNSKNLELVKETQPGVAPDTISSVDGARRIKLLRDGIKRVSDVEIHVLVVLRHLGISIQIAPHVVYHRCLAIKRSHHRVIEYAGVIAYLCYDRSPLVLVQRVATAVVVAIWWLAICDATHTHKHI